MRNNWGFFVVYLNMVIKRKEKVKKKKKRSRRGYLLFVMVIELFCLYSVCICRFFVVKMLEDITE